MKMNDEKVWDGEIIRAPLPHGMDPFINTPLLSLGKGADGEERFWISSWNSNSGSLGVLITESGKERIYRFDSPNYGFYSAAQEDEDTLWLCGDLSRVVRLSLSTGKIETYDTEAPSALVFSGMILDPVSGKLFGAAYPPPSTTAFVFDYRNRKPVRVYPNVCQEHYMRTSFSNGDGTYSILLDTPDVTLLQWNPKEETVETVVLDDIALNIPPQSLKNSGVYRLISHDDGGQYFPHWGWYNPLKRTMVVAAPCPEREMTWFARKGGKAWGVSSDSENATVAVWDMTSGQVSHLCTIPDGHILSVHLSVSGKVVAVNMYGEFFRFDGESGGLELSKRLPTDSIGYVDCLCRIDEDRLLGTPFITQRFWEMNLKTGRGYDCGRAAPGRGEILQSWKVGDKVYMAAYAGGELVEYNPHEHPHFPENPRVVADPPGGMRPVAGTDDGRHLYYSCSHEYGILGSVLTKYDTVSGMVTYRDEVIPEQMIQSLCYDKETKSLMAGTTINADCQSCPPASQLCYFARIDVHDLSVIEKYAAPEGTELATVCGPMGENSYLCTVSGQFPTSRTRWFVVTTTDFTIPELEEMEILPESLRSLIATEKQGLFILWIEDQFELWNMVEQKRLLLLHKDSTVYRCFVQDDSVYLVKPKEVIVLENCLSGF